MTRTGVLRIGELSRRTGVSTDLLRTWERRYGLLRPARSPAGYRLYSADDVARVRLMCRYLERRVSAAEAAALVRSAGTAPEPDHPGVPDQEARAALAALTAALDRIDEAAADAALTGLLRGFSGALVLRDVVLPVMRRVGDAWACGTASVAHEHFASQLFEGRIRAIGRGVPASGPPVVLACPPGELHQLGLLAFAAVLRESGRRVAFLGADTPLAALEEAVRRTDAGAVVLGAVDAARVDAAADRLRRLGAQTRTYLGGAAAGTGAAAAAGAVALPADLLAAARALAEG